MYKKHMAVFWTAEEIDLVPDLADWEKLNDDERNFSNIDEILTVVSGHPTIIQRPLFEYKEAVKIGLSELSKAIEELN